MHTCQLRPKRLWRVIVVALSAFLIGSPAAHALDGTIIDTKADPKVDFGRYAFGLWLDKTPLPPDRPAYGTFDEISDPLEQKLLDIVNTPQPSADGAKLNALFQQATDQGARNAAGFAPIRTELNAIARAKSLRQLFKVGDGLGPVSVFVGPGPDDPTRNALAVGAANLGLGGRDPYLATDASSKKIQQQYVLFLSKELKLAGYPTAIAKREASKVFALERKMAALTLDQRDVASDYALANTAMSYAQLQQLTPEVDWTTALDGAQLAPSDVVYVTEPKFVKNVSALFRKTTLTTAKAFEITQLLNSAGPYLDDKIGELRFDFFGRTLSGQEQRSPQVVRSLNQVSDLMPDAIGQLYSQKYFTAADKTEITTMTTEIIDAFRVRIANNSWMSSETKAKATQSSTR